jgi:hypothetical protein
MTLEMMKDFLLWCSIINIGLMLLWFLFFVFGHDFIYRQHGKWFKISVEKFDAIHYAGMAIFKMFIIFFNIIPYFALLIVS